MPKQTNLARILRRSGLLDLLDRFWGQDRLTVLAYHRICDPHTPDFHGYAANVSATPEQFAQQMDYVRARFNVIDLAALQRFVTQGEPLPPRPLLLTFDDGYLDNYTNAYPILRARGLPAVFFLVTEWVGSDHHPWWDRCGYVFAHTARTRATLPLTGAVDLTPGEPRRLAEHAFIRALKFLPETEKNRLLETAFHALDVIPAPDSRLFFDWDTARTLAADGNACQPHTVSHPILTRISPDEAQREISESCARIAGEIGQPAMAFAYPNGTAHDYNAAVLRQLQVLDVPLAFTLNPGPLRLRQVRRHAWELPRIFIMHHDSFDRFVVKLMGLPALLARQRFFHGPTARGSSG